MLCDFLRMFLLRLISIWALVRTVSLAPQWPNSRFERKVLQLNESNSTFTESIAGHQEQSKIQQATLPRVILLQDLQPPTFGILNKLPYLTLQPPLFALPQQIEDDILTSLPGPASNSVELEKRSKIYAQENYSSRSEETPIGNDVQLETTVSLDNNTVLAQSESTENSILEISQSDSTTSLDLSSETPTTEINDVSSAAIASRQGKESEGTTVITKIINEVQATFNDETTNHSLNFKSSTQNEFGDTKTTTTSELFQYSTTFNDVSAQQIIFTTQSNLNFEDTTTTEVYPNDQNIELINSRYGVPEATSAEELTTIITTTSNDGLDIQSVAEDDLVSDAPSTKSNIGGVEPKDSIEITTSTQTEFPKFDPNEFTNLISRSGIFETIVTDGLVSIEKGGNQELGTTVTIEETTLATNSKDLLETEDASKFSTTAQVQEVEDISPSNLDEFDLRETATTSKSACEDSVVTGDVILDDEPVQSTQSAKEFTTHDVELSNRISLVEGREDQQPNEVVISANLESSSENPTITEVTTINRNDETTIKPDVNSPFGVSEVSETSAEELVVLSTTEDLKLSPRVSEAEDIAKEREDQQPNEIVISANLESSSENPTTTEVTTINRNDETTIKPDVNSPFGVSEVSETSAEELVVLSTTEDLKLSSRVTEAEDIAKEREDQQPNEIVISANLESSFDNPTTTEFITTERITETTVKEVESIGTVNSPYGLSNETSAEELVLLTTTAPSVDIATKSILEDGQASKPDGTTSSAEEASTNVPATQPKLQPRINIEEEAVTISNEKVSEELLPPPLENIKSDVSVSYGLKYKPDSNDITYTISTTVKSILTHKSGEDGGKVTSEVNAVVNATSVLQDQNNASGFSTALTGNVSSIRQGPEIEAAGAPPDGGFGIEVNKTNNAPEINIRFLPPFASAPNGIHGRLSESDAKLSTTIIPNVFDFNKGSKGSGQTTFTLPSNTQFTIKLDKPGIEPSVGKASPRENNFGQNILRSSLSDFGSIKGNFNSNSGSIKGNLGQSTTPSSSQFTIKLDKPDVGADPNFSVQFNSAPETGIQSNGSITGNLDAKGGFVPPSSSSEVGRSANLTNDAQFAINVNKNNGGPNLSFQFSSVPNTFPSRSNSESVRETLASNSEARAPGGFDLKEQVNFNSVINIGNNPPKSARLNDNNGETKSKQTNGNDSDKPSKFRSVTIDTSVANDPSELLKNYNNKNGLNTPGTSSPGRYVQAKYVGQTSVNPATTPDESITNDSFKNKFGFDLGFLNRGIYSKSPPKVNPPKTEAPQTHFNKPFRPRTFGGSNKSDTFGVSIGPYRDTIIKHTGKGWSLRTYDKLILHTGLSGQYL